jgi:hypothetical protein
MKEKTISLRHALCTLLLLTSFYANALDYYWVGGKGNWSDYTHHWATSSGGNIFHSSVPSSIDNVFFDANSFTTTGQTVTVDQTIVQCNNMSWVGVTRTPTLFSSYDKTLSIYGSLTLSPAMKLNCNGEVHFEATTPGQTITSAGQSFGFSIFFFGVGGEWTLQDDLKVNHVLVVQKGTLNTNGKTVSAFQFITSSKLTLGASVLNISEGWYTDGMTFLDAGTSTININGIDGYLNFYFEGGGFTYNHLNFTNATGRGILKGNNTFNGNVIFKGDGAVGGDNTFNDLLLSAGHSYTFFPTNTQTINGTLTANGNATSPVTIGSAIQGSPANLHKDSGTICLDYVWLSDITASGGAIFNAGKAPERSKDLGGNSGWLFTGGCSTCSSIIIDSIVAPLDPVSINNAINLVLAYSGTISEARINWGDSTNNQIINTTNNPLVVSHTYLTPGVYSIYIELNNDCGETVSSSYQYIVIYDPNGGFVTGGGWINSPVGAYRPNLSVSGKAIFGFESKYQKGATVPSGNTEFNFQAGDMNFKSSSYEWLTVSGSRAQFKGTGTINGAGSYGFILTAVDGNLSNQVTPDLIRIKIWDKVSNSIVYDNQYGAADNSSLTTQLAGGSIMIQTKSTGPNANRIAVVEEQANKLKIASYPNPSSSFFTLVPSGSKNERMNVKVTDVIGRIIEVRSNLAASNRFTIGQKYSRGIYFIEITQGTEKVIMKLIKN